MEEDFLGTLDLLLEHRWLYQFPVTQILVKDILCEFPNGWMEPLKGLTIEQLNDLVVGDYADDCWPSSLLDFIKKCRKIKAKLSEDSFPLTAVPRKLPRNLTLGLNPKKQHEVFHLAQLTHELCLEKGLSVIVDLGAGLGYICQILHHLFNYKVLGLESNSSITETANQRQNMLYSDSKTSVNYFCLKISENSSKEIENLVNSLTNETKDFCLIGLHSCGDLSINALKLFRHMERAKLLIMMSCCYHKIEFSHKEKNFKDFPMSNGLKKLYEDARNNFDDVEEILERPFLRLACQEPSERWEHMNEEEHERHSLCLMARAVIELFCRKNEITLTKIKRKSTRKSQWKNFNSYFRNFVDRYEFDGRNFDEKWYDEIEKIWYENEEKLLLSEIYTGLQLLLQGPAEYLVLNDRKCWLMEQGFVDTRIISVLNKKLSPRSHAIVSSRR